MARSKVVKPEKHRKVRHEERCDEGKLTKYGDLSKFRIAFVSRKIKKGKAFQVFVDPRRVVEGTTTVPTYTSPEAYSFTKEQVAELQDFRKSTALSMLTSPNNKVAFRWVTRAMLRKMRQLAKTGGTVLTK